MSLMNIARETWVRFRAETPGYFRKLIWFGVALGSIGGALMEQHVASYLPESITKMAGTLFTIGVVASAVAKLAVKNPEVIEQSKIKKLWQRKRSTPTKERLK